MSFIDFKHAVQKQLNKMTKTGELFQVDIDKDDLYETYLKSFPQGTNPIYRERTEHDCSCCKNFIRNIGGTVSINSDGSLSSIWDLELTDFRQTVSDAMSVFVKQHSIGNVYRNDTKEVGVDKNYEDQDGVIKEWDHFFYELPSKLVMKSGIDTYKGRVLSDKEVLERSLKEVSKESIDIVLELIEQNSLYRGQEHLHTVKALLKAKDKYDLVDDELKETYTWNAAIYLGSAGRFRNTVVGTLLTDISDGVELEKAVKSFESKVAPSNYQRTSAPITSGMVKKLHEKLHEHGLEDSLNRRYARSEDLTINNVLFANREAKKSMGALDVLSSEVKDIKPNLDNIQEVPVQDFINNILPKADSLELMLEGTHTSNLVSLIAPESSEAKNMFKWGNTFSWSYNGEVADSIKARVKAAGGSVEGDVRASLSWFNYDDLDISVKEPNGNIIFFSNKTSMTTDGHLDVDMNAGGGRSREAVENITWPSINRMSEGEYTVRVHNYELREMCDEGFEVELDVKGNSKLFSYDKGVRHNEVVDVVKFVKDSNGISVKESISTKSSTKEVWGVVTQKWTKVGMVMNSPNHWDGEETGNKHLFFMLDGCKNPNSARGFYNEFLSSDLRDCRKAFEVLGSKIKAEYSENQLSGLGFSSTQRNSILCKVSGSFNRVINIKF